jgi:UDP-N-acetylmuramate dehydrogenase
VEWAVSRGYGGIENLSLIPGLAGAASVQNIGAYGAEVRETITRVRGIDISDCTLKEFSNNECKFGYRDSIFKRVLKGKYLITKVFFKLSKRPEFRIDYGSLRQETEKSGEISLRTIRDAVINLRRNKLPDPDIIGNAGSFFKNPVINREKGEALKSQYPQIPSYDDPSGGIKLAAGWMIEQCGWKGKRIGDAGVYEKQSLVLVNHGDATGKEIYDLSEKIRKSVREEFGIDLEREVEIIGSI